MSSRIYTAESLKITPPPSVGPTPTKVNWSKFILFKLKVGGTQQEVRG